MNLPKNVQELIDNSNRLFDMKEELRIDQKRAYDRFEKAALKKDFDYAMKTAILVDKAYSKCFDDWHMAKNMAYAALASHTGLKV